MAYSFGDGWAAEKVFDRIGDQWDEDIWQSSEAFESAKKWAKFVGPLLAKRHNEEEFAETNLHSAEGQHYQTVFAEMFQTWLQPCLEQVTGRKIIYFKLLTKDSRDGPIDEMTNRGELRARTRST